MSRTVRADGERLAPAEGNQALENNLISADLPSLGQLRPRDEIHSSRATGTPPAHSLLEQKQLLTSPRLACALRYISCLTIHSYPETIVLVENYAPTSSGRLFF